MSSSIMSFLVFSLDKIRMPWKVCKIYAVSSYIVIVQEIVMTNFSFKYPEWFSLDRCNLNYISLLFKVAVSSGYK